MAFSPGKNVGRVSIRVLPDTTGFRRDLKDKLAVIDKTTSYAVRVDKANVDRNQVRESIRRQMAEFKDLDIGANVQVTVDSARIKRGKLRESIQQQFDRMDDVRVYISPRLRKADEDIFLRQVERLRERASNKSVNLGVNAQTFLASRQIAFTARDRIVNLIVRVSKSSMTAALTTLAALSGARLSWKWIDSLIDKVKELDRNLPKILNWTSAITALGAAVFASTSGLVGIGQGLFSILPAFLVLPGLILNAAGSATVLIVALKHAKEELGALSGDMNSLGVMIRETFWTKARQPIVDLVKGLMPQLRTAFHDLSTGVGEFTAALAQAFGSELANGRLASIFNGIADGWRVLGTGASGFAGALVNLSEIAAKYTPRLAAWFVRQANTFDNFLTSIATDGRLERWMEDAIDSMYDLWDAARGFGGVMAGIWQAADRAGSAGLHGFAQMLLEWRNIVNGADFQRGLTAIFRGSAVAMDAFGGAIASIGRLFSDMPNQMERFIGSAGGFIGKLIDESAKALNNVNVKLGLDGFSTGLDRAISKITPSLQPIADTFGNFLGLLGDLAANLLPTAAGVLADLMPTIDSLIGTVKDVLPGLTDVVGKLSDALGPALERLADALGPVVIKVLDTLGSVIDRLTPSLVDLVGNVGPQLAEALGKFVDVIGPILDKLDLNLTVTGLDIISDPSQLFDPQKITDMFNEIQVRGGWYADFLGAIADIVVQFTYLRLSVESVFKAIGGIISGFAITVAQGAVQIGTSIISGLLVGANNMFPGFIAWLGSIPGYVRAIFAGAQAWLMQAGSAIINGLLIGANVVFGTVLAWFSGIGSRIAAAANIGINILVGVGRGIIDGLLRGIKAGFEAVKSFVTGIGPWIAANKGPISYDRRLLIPAGKSIMQGLNQGLTSGFVNVQRNIGGMNGALGSAFGGGGALAGVGAQVNVTMPLLPGETPREQRENLVRELSLAF